MRGTTGASLWEGRMVVYLGWKPHGRSLPCHPMQVENPIIIDDVSSDMLHFFSLIVA
jgi:hypothetical protein